MVENLERRSLLTTVAAEGSSFISLSSTGTLTVTGSKMAESITIDSIHRGKLRVSVEVRDGTLPAHVREYSVNAVKRLRVYGANGADTIRVETDVRGNSQLWGGRGDDTIITHFDDTTLFGERGNDVLISDPAVALDQGVLTDNTPYTQLGIDETRNQLLGGPGADTLRSRGGEDSITGNSGNDRFEPLNSLEQAHIAPIPPDRYPTPEFKYVTTRVRLINIETVAQTSIDETGEVKVRFGTVRDFSYPS